MFSIQHFLRPLPAALLLAGALASADLSAQIVSQEMIPMRDGTLLATDIYIPWPGTGRYPTILVRTPYGKEPWYLFASGLTLDGYAVAIQDTRGHGGSQGEPSLFRTAADDGYDTVENLAAREWSNGRVGMFGASALGITQYMAAGAAPPHLTCMCVFVATPDLYDHIAYPGGCYRQYDVEGWIYDNGEEGNLPLVLDHPARDAQWDSIDLDGKVAPIDIPTVHVGGWYDMMAAGTLKAFRSFDRFSVSRGRQMLIMGPWTHGGETTTVQGELTYPLNSTFDWFPTLLDQWFGYFLKGEGEDPTNGDRVMLYRMGDVYQPSTEWNQWVSMDSFPATNHWDEYYLDADGSLDRTEPDRGARVFTSEPSHPVPTIGGTNLILPAGPYDQASILDRSDVAVYSTAELSSPLEVTGRVKARIYLAADAPDIDLAARLVDIYPDGRWMWVAGGILKARRREGMEREDLLEPGSVVQLTVDLWETNIIFAPGHRIGLILSASNYPKYAVNPQTGEPVNQEAGSRPATITILTGSRYPSALLLPSVDAVPHPRPCTPPSGGSSRSAVWRRIPALIPAQRK